MENKLVISLSPHVHGGDSVKKNMYGVLIALIPAFLVSLYFFGLGALIVTATSDTHPHTLHSGCKAGSHHVWPPFDSLSEYRNYL